MSIDHIRLSQVAKEQLIKLKRHTGIKHWNILCRWGFCLSLAEDSIPVDAQILAASNVEMSWKVFGGPNHELYMGLLKERCLSDGLGTGPDTLAQQFRLHLHRGISYLAGNKKLRKIDDLISIAVASA